MGLCINWTVHAPETASLESVTDQLRAWREACLDLPFDEVADIVHFTEAEVVRRLENRADSFRWFLVQACAYVAINRDTPDEFSGTVDPVEVVGFTAFAGDECEPMNCFLARYPEQALVGRHLVKPGIIGWRGSSFAKTQYASSVAAQHFLKCHVTITAALDAAKAAGLLKSVLARTPKLTLIFGKGGECEVKLVRAKGHQTNQECSTSAELAAATAIRRPRVVCALKVRPTPRIV
jgi:hypothetical protein